MHEFQNERGIWSPIIKSPKSTGWENKYPRNPMRQEWHYKDICFKDIELHSQNRCKIKHLLTILITILSSTVNVIEGPMWPFNEHKILHFDDE